jgi:hypothetical protein
VVDDERPTRRAGLGLRLFRWLVLVPLTLLCGWATLGPPTLEAGLFGLGVLVATVAAFLRDPRSRRWGLAMGLGLTALVLAVRLGVGGAGETLRNTTPPGGGRFTDRLLPERDVALGGSRLLMVAGAMPEDVPGLLGHLSDGYDRMRAAEGAVPSPVLSTLLFDQTPEDHGVLRVAPTGEGDGETALVFLHGFMGSTTVACWHLAQAASPVGIETVCPAMHWRARWESPAGRAIARQTIADLRAGGAQRIVLAGLSAGAIGASKIARDLDVDAVILISGASRHPRPARLSTLVLQGARDQMTPPRFARAYADRVPGAGYVEYPDAGHWLILSHHEQITPVIRAFLAE